MLVAWDSIAPDGDANHAAFAITKTADVDDSQLDVRSLLIQ